MISIVLVQQNLSEFKEDMELDFKLFSLLILVVHTLSLDNPSEAVQASLSISIYLRWRSRLRQNINKEKYGIKKNVSNPFFS